jgi:integrase
MIHGMYIIDKVTHTHSELFSDGATRKIEFSLSLKRVDESLASIYGDLQTQADNLVTSAGIQLVEGQKTHVLRHTFASHFMMNGRNILVLQRILGHANIRETMRYAHFAPDHLEAAVELNPLAMVYK